MTLEQELFINQYGQNLVPIETLVEDYNKILEPDDRKMYLNHLVSLIIQSKSEDSDISRAIENSHLRETFTPCVLLKKRRYKIS